MQRTLVILDLPRESESSLSESTLTRRQMQRVVGGRNVIVKVDGGSLGTVNDFDINNAIWEGRIGGPMLN
jgi:hypothetical protein